MVSKGGGGGGGVVYLMCFIPIFAWLLLYSTQPRIVKHIDCETLPKIDGILFPFMTETISSTTPNTILDILAAIVYILHFTIPFLFTIYLYLMYGVSSVNRFAWQFGIVNLVAVIIQILHPTAPPWYDCQQQQDEFTMKMTKGNPAGLERVDQLLHISIFTKLYSESKMVFGAFPSLHASWPLTIALFKPAGAFRWGIFHSLWVGWAALYLKHHFFVDVIGGWLLVLIVLLIDWQSVNCKLNHLCFYSRQQQQKNNDDIV